MLRGEQATLEKPVSPHKPWAPDFCIFCPCEFVKNCHNLLSSMQACNNVTMSNVTMSHNVTMNDLPRMEVIVTAPLYALTQGTSVAASKF